MVVLEILSPLSLNSIETGAEILDLWKAYLPNLLPDLYGNCEPIDHLFDKDRIDEALSLWKWPFLATRKTPSFDASIWMRKGANQSLHSTLIFRLETGAATATQLVSFLKAASLLLKADFACIHYLTATEIERGRSNKTITFLDKTRKKPRFFVASQDLQQRLPGLFWTTLFGAPYVNMFGRDRLLSSPVHRVEMIGSDTAVLQLSEALTDIAEHSKEFDDIRKGAEAHLGVGAFFQSEVPPGFQYTKPNFRFET